MTHVLTCVACRALLVQYAAKTLPTEQVLIVTAHLATCLDCQAEIVAIRSLIGIVSQPFEGDTPPPASFMHVMAAVRPLLHGDAAVNHHTDPRISRIRPPNSLSTSRSQSVVSPYPDHARLSAIVALTVVILLVALATFIFARPRSFTSTSISSNTHMIPITADQLHGWDLHAVAFATLDEGWAVGSTIPPTQYDARVNHEPYVSPVMLHYQHGQWYQESLPPKLMAQSMVLTAVQMVSPTEGWAIARTRLPPTTESMIFGELLHYHDGQWVVASQEFLTPLEQLAFVSPTDGWVVGDTAPDGSGALVLHYDGVTWTQIHDPVFTSVSLTAVSVAGAVNLWAAGVLYQGTGPDGAAPGIFLHYDGARWTRHALPDGMATARIAAIALPSANAGWAVGTLPGLTSSSGANLPDHPAEAIVLRFQQGAWLEAARYQNPLADVTFAWNAIAIDPVADGWAVGTHGVLLHLSSSGALTMTNSIPSAGIDTLAGVTMLSPTEIWAVGSPGVILHYTHGAWQRYLP